MKKIRTVFLILIMCFFAKVTQAEDPPIASELIGSWTVQYTDLSQSTWVIEGAEYFQHIPFNSYAYGVKQTEGEEDVPFRLYWMVFTMAYFYTEDLGDIFLEPPVSVLDFKVCSFK